jgi:hypothetical protein
LDFRTRASRSKSPKVVVAKPQAAGASRAAIKASPVTSTGDLVFTKCDQMFTIVVRVADFYTVVIGFFSGREEAQETRKKGNAAAPLMGADGTLMRN